MNELICFATHIPFDARPGYECGLFESVLLISAAQIVPSEIFHEKCVRSEYSRSLLRRRVPWNCTPDVFVSNVSTDGWEEDTEVGGEVHTLCDTDGV
jgi:hypothetical protein